MTRKRFEKLLMGCGWSKKGVKDITGTLRWMRRTKCVMLSYAEQYERYTRCGEFRLELPF